MTPRKSVFLLAAYVVCAVGVRAQSLQVESFGADMFSAEAQRCDVQTRSGECCALLKVLVIDADMHFGGSRLVKSEPHGKNEYWVWLAPGAKDITLRSGGAGELKVRFADLDSGIPQLQGKAVYELKLLRQAQEQTVQVEFKCNAPKAQMYIDGYPVEHPNGIYAIAPGSHTLRAESPHHVTYNTTFEVKQKKKRQHVDITMDSAATDPAAQLELSYYYTNKYNKPKKNFDCEKSLYWLRQAVSQGYAPAQYELGCLYYYGGEYVYCIRYNSCKKYISKDEEAGLRLLKMAALQGYEKAQEGLGYIYMSRSDYDEAARWFGMACEQHHNEDACERRKRMEEFNSKKH